LTEEQGGDASDVGRGGQDRAAHGASANVVLLAAEGSGLKEIEEKTRPQLQSCLKWRKRFLESGLEGSKIEPGAGGPQSTPRKSE
jgi:hypothetical protein